MKKTVYDGEKLFRKYCDDGAASGARSLARWANQIGMHPTGEASMMGVHYAMWHWAFYNPEQAYPLWKEWHFERHPEKPVPSFQEFLLELRERGRNANVGGKRALQRFCAKYGLEWDYDVHQNQVIQITKRDHPLYQMLMIVDSIEGETVKAHTFVPDKVFSDLYPEPPGRETIQQELKVGEFGIIGKAIV